MALSLVRASNSKQQSLLAVLMVASERERGARIKSLKLWRDGIIGMLHATRCNQLAA